MAELALLISVGSHIGTLNTIGLVLLTAIIGTWLLRREGLATFARFKAKAERGEMPAAEILSGFALAAGGALLLTPGFMTDIIGLLLVLPGSRHIIWPLVIATVYATRNKPPTAVI